MNPKVLIVEDKMIVAQDIKDILQSMGCIVTDIVSSGESAIESFISTRPEIILMDIRLKGKMDGIQTSKKIQALGPATIIYLTAHSDPKILQSAFETHPTNFIVKPFNTQDIQIAIGLAQSRLADEINNGSHILFRHQGILEKLPIDEILFAKADGSYTIIQTADKTLTASFNLAHFLEQVDGQFLRVHRSYVIHMDHVDSISANKIFIGSHAIPVSRSFKNEFLKRFKSK